MTEEALEKARELDSLEESPKKDKIFILEDYDYLNDHQVIYIDLREGFELYGYDGYGEKLDIKRRKVPQEVLDLEKIVQAEGTTNIGDYFEPA